MDNRTALIFTHKGSQAYLWYCLEQAKLACPNCRIILLGDEANVPENSEIEHYFISDYMESANEFEKVYRHQSSNPYWYELICFQRWFIIKDFVIKNNINSFFGCDTDIMIYEDVTKFIPEGDFKLTIANKNGPQCSYFTNETIKDFCDYMMKQYTDPVCLKRLLGRYRVFIDNKYPGGNCDMTMFTFCEEDYPGSVIDYGFDEINSKKNMLYCCSNTLDYMETEKKNGFVLAKIRFYNNKAYIIKKDGTKLLCPVVHFLGEYKNFMHDYSTLSKDKIKEISDKFGKLKKNSLSVKKIIKQFIPYGLVTLLKKN